MKSKIAIVILLFWSIYSCNTKSSDKDTTEKATSTGKTISDKYWVPDRVEEIKSIKPGLFIRLADNSLLTITGNQTYLSKDEGNTWSPFSLIADTAKFDISAGSLIRTSHNVIILSFVNLKEKANWNWRKDIHDSPGSILPTYAVRSIDVGKTWQDLQKLHDDWTGANRDMIETSDGSIVFTSMIMRHNPGHHTVLTYTSKDEGKTWAASNIIDLGGTGNHSGVMESTLAQLKDGRLWMLLRTNWGNFWQTFSYDDGLTWKEVGPTDIDASSSPGLLRRLQSGRLVLVWNRLFPEGKKEYPLRGGDGNLTEVPVSWQREELSIMFSDDDGKTWNKPTVIARVTKKDTQLSYPSIFEAKPGELWITTRFQGDLTIRLFEKDFL